MKNELNPKGLFGNNLGKYIVISKEEHEIHLLEFEELLLSFLDSIENIRGIDTSEDSFEFRLSKPFEDIIVLLSNKSKYIRLDFSSRDNVICYLNNEGYRDDLDSDYWWILKVLLDNKDLFISSIFKKLKRHVAYKNCLVDMDIYNDVYPLFTSDSFIPIVKGFLPKIMHVFFKKNNANPIIFTKEFDIKQSFFSDIYKFRFTHMNMKVHKFEFTYDNFLIEGVFTYDTFVQYSITIFDIYHGKNDKVELYSCNHRNEININTNEGPQDYRISAILPLIKVYNFLLKETE